MVVLQVYRQIRLALIISLRTGIIGLMVGITKHSLVGKDVVQLVVERKDILRRIYCIQVCIILKGSYNHSNLLHRVDVRLSSCAYVVLWRISNNKRSKMTKHVKQITLRIYKALCD